MARRFSGEVLFATRPVIAVIAEVGLLPTQLVMRASALPAVFLSFGRHRP